MNSDTIFDIALMVAGDAACFRRPEFVNDLVTYDVMPPTVANRLIDAILPRAATRLKCIRVLNPIVRRWRTVTTPRGIKRCLALEDVAYVLEV